VGRPRRGLHSAWPVTRRHASKKATLRTSKASRRHRRAHRMGKSTLLKCRRRAAQATPVIGTVTKSRMLRGSASRQGPRYSVFRRCAVSLETAIDNVANWAGDIRRAAAACDGRGSRWVNVGGLRRSQSFIRICCRAAGKRVACAKADTQGSQDHADGTSRSWAARKPKRQIMGNLLLNWERRPARRAVRPPDLSRNDSRSPPRPRLDHCRRGQAATYRRLGGCRWHGRATFLRYAAKREFHSLIMRMGVLKAEV